MKKQILRFRWLFPVVLGSLIVSCQSALKGTDQSQVKDRIPSSFSSLDLDPTIRTELNKLYLSQLHLQLEQKKIFDVYESQFIKALETSTKKQNQFAGLYQLTSEKLKSELPPQYKIDFENKLRNMSEKLSPNPAFQRPQLLNVDFSLPWRTALDQMVIPDLTYFPPEKSGLSKVFYMSRIGAKEFRLQFSNFAFSNTAHPEKFLEIKPQGSGAKGAYVQKKAWLEAQISCDGSLVISEVLARKKIKPGHVGEFHIQDSKWLGVIDHNPELVLSDDVKECQLKFRNPFANLNSDSQDWHVVKLKNEETFPFTTELANNVEACILPKATELAGPERFFLTPKYLSMTCPSQAESIEPLSDPLDALNSKIESLLGRKIPLEDLEKKNPFMELDFSQAPKLDAIFISYLVFRSDFYGNIIARLVKHHADQGTQVRIITSRVIELAKDKVLLRGIISHNPNIKLQEYKYKPQKGDRFRQWLSQFHRNAHTKLLITLSRSQPNANRLFIGGRNIHDGFLFKDAPDHSAYPTLVNYGKSEESYSFWRDYEVVIKAPALIEEIASHYLALWHRDSKTQFIRSLSVNVPVTQNVDPNYFQTEKPLMRHLISIPYQDANSLEDFYVDLFNSAEKSIWISTPYFRPTDKLTAALHSAAKRGVSVTLQTRIQLDGDTSKTIGNILTEVNKTGINEFLHSIKIYEWTEIGVILHSKIVLVDGKLSMVGGINLNKRSFFHDLENGMLIYNPQYGQVLTRMLEDYASQSREVTQEQKVKWWFRPVIRLIDEEL